MTTPLPELLARYINAPWWPDGLTIDYPASGPPIFFLRAHADSRTRWQIPDAHVESIVFGAVYPYISDFYWIKPNGDGTWTLCAPDSFTALIGSSGDEGPYYASKLEAALVAWEEVK